MTVNCGLACAGMESCTGNVCTCPVGHSRGIDRMVVGSNHCFRVNGTYDCAGFNLEMANNFYVYPAPLPGLVPLYRCTGVGVTLLMQDCGPRFTEATLGWVAPMAQCGSVPLQGVRSLAGVHYCFGQEYLNLLAAGWGDLGVAAHVWATPN